MRLLPVLIIACFCALLPGCAGTQSLNGKVVVITGASSGFGKGAALKMAGEGAHVVLAARRTDLLNELAQQCQARGATALVVTTDVGKEQDVANLAAAATAKFGRIDIWINDAGVGAFGRFDEIPLNEQIRVVNTNLEGTIYGSYYALRQFRRQGSGTLINLGSIDSRIPIAYLATYNATKHAIMGLTDSIYEELRLSGDKNIHACTIMPWSTDTPWWDHAANYTGKKPRNLLLDDPGKVVDAIVDAAKSDDPAKDITVGWKATTIVVSKSLAPNFTDDLSSGLFEHELKKASPTGPTSGAVLQPMPTGTGVSGGVRDRMNAEDNGK